MILIDRNYDVHTDHVLDLFITREWTLDEITDYYYWFKEESL